MILGDSVRRGLAAGVVAGLLAGLFALLVGEVSVREAIRLEQAASAPADDPVGPASDGPVDTPADEAPLVDRTTQQALLPVATGIVGAAIGGLFGLAWAGLRPHLRDQGDWHATLKLGTATWAAVALFPGLAQPANPPAVGDPATIGARSGAYVAAVAGGLVVTVVLWSLARWLRDLGFAEVPRQVIVGLSAVVTAAALATALPGPAPATGVPAQLLWEFRLASLATQLILWSCLAGMFGWLAHRAQMASAAVVGDPT